MAFINISYNIEKDLQNYRNSLFDFKYPLYGRENVQSRVGNFLFPSFVRNLEEIKDIEEKTKFAREYLINFEKKNSDYFKLQIKTLSEYWSKNESKYIQSLEDYFGVKISFNSVDAYYTTLSIAPYNVKDRWFMVSIFGGLASQVNTIMHEFMHLVFLTNFEKYCIDKGLKKQSVLDINEALTILLNFQFGNLLITPAGDSKPATQDLKNEIVTLWKKKTPFPVILDRLIELRK